MAVAAPRKRNLGYSDSAYWGAHPDEAEYEIARIRRALERIGTDPREIDAAEARVRKAMAGGST